ncbi:protein phosphatase 2C domain-containing protein [Parabacteroides sp. PF5-9]|uniref:PP2C family protein-serine/threonine phosphatase n=1 Tax=Parabacteroides sp. PF5-9 TaxID=1742404 RepID=UPI002473642C|nr:protein phosphatase 2C domain-containing protein [Parabacteroides sp. PF5-9]MDH6356463.1 serine/threonine protein phosphatase PrpC [Parabacteroides sp. PF5-9]
MNISIGKPNAICEKGGRLNNEDSIYPQPEAIQVDQRLFLVCDGVGGAEKGEIASSLACESIATYFSTYLERDKDPSPDFIQKSIQYTETCFDSYISQHPEAKGMATTMTLLYTGHSGVLLAHIGDSRIYQFRNNQILYQTEDHSLVNSLVKLGKITKEEASFHPQKNVILRAIQGDDRPTEADVVLLDDIQENDIFFMCTDGVLEQINDLELSQIVSQHKSSENIKDVLFESCNGRTRDNFSFYIIPIQNVQDNGGFKQNILSFLYSFV